MSKTMFEFPKYGTPEWEAKHKEILADLSRRLEPVEQKLNVSVHLFVPNALMVGIVYDTDEHSLYIFLAPLLVIDITLPYKWS